MYAGAMHTWGWFKQLTRMEEQKFSKTTELPIDYTSKEDIRKSHDVPWSFSDLMFITTCIQIDLMYLCNMGYIFNNDRSALPPFKSRKVIIMYATWGPALIYMEVFLGQYVQHGCLYLKNISPLTCSTIGYGMLLTMYFFSISSVTRLADGYMFLFRMFSAELPWMVCPEGSTPATCIDRPLLVQCYLENRQDNCYPKLGPELLSSRIYYKTTHSTFLNSGAFLFFGWLTIYIAVKRSLSDTRIMIKKLLMTMLVLFICLLMPLLVHFTRGLSIVPFFRLRQGALLSIQTWIGALKDFLMDHAVVRGGYQLIGCHIKSGPTAANLTIYSCALTYLITVFSQIFSTGILGVLIIYMKITHVEEELFFPKYMKLFSFYPFALGMLEVRQIWSFIFFMFIILTSISHTVVNIAVLEESIYNDFPVMLRYQVYVKVILCALGFLIGALTDFLSGPNTYEDEIVLQIAYRLTVIVILILTFSVGYIYGMERFSDDMNFLNGSQPTTYWKICWKSLPFGMLILIGGEMIDIEFPNDNVAKMTSNIVYVFLLGLAVLHLLHRIVMSIKARNVAGILFQASPLWGPPFPEDRRMRNTYNPREETKYWRKSNLCTHHCLLDKDFIISIIFREIYSRSSSARRNDSLQRDSATITEQSKQNQVVIAIDNVSSLQLESFEEQVKQKVKFLEKLEGTETKIEQRQTMLTRNDSTVTESIEELDKKIQKIIRREEQELQLGKEINEMRVQKTSSKIKQRRMPTLVPKETPRPKKTPTALVTANQKDTKNKVSTKVHTLAVRVPNFSLEPLARYLHHPTPTENTDGRESLNAFKCSSLRREISRAEDGPSNADARRAGLPASYRISPRQLSISKPRWVARIPQLPIWPLPLNTPRPIATPRLSRSSSSSTSTATRKDYHQPLGHFQNMRLPSKANLLFPTFTMDVNYAYTSSASSLELSELSELQHDPVLREILGSVHSQLIPTCSSTDTTHADPIVSSGQDISQCHPRTSIARELSLIRSSREGPHSRKPLTRKLSHKNASVLSPPFRVMAKGLKIDNSLATCGENEIERNKRRAESLELSVDIDQAIQIRIENLLRGVPDANRSTDQQSSILSAIPNARGHHRRPKMDQKGKGTVQILSHRSKSKNLTGPSRTTSSVAARFSALGKRISNRMPHGSTSPRIPQVPDTTNTSNKQSGNAEATTRCSED